jgi:heme-degrading monooxygenase HmoA
VFALYKRKDNMIAVIFEALPAEGKWEEYISLAATLRVELENISGFISVERFQSLADPQKVLSLSFWKDEASVREWRNTELHRQAQAKGRASVFGDYRIRVAIVQRDYSLHSRNEAPADSQKIHHP